MLNQYALLIKGFIIVAIIGALVASVHFWKKSIISETTNTLNNAWIKKEKDADIAAQKILDEKNKSIMQSQAHIDVATKMIVQRNQEIANAKKDYDDLRTQYNHGIKRMSIRVAASGASDTARHDNNSPVAVRNNDEVRELVPEISDDILSFAKGYSDNLRKLNQCIFLYNTAKDEINQREAH